MADPLQNQYVEIARRSRCLFQPRCYDASVSLQAQIKALAVEAGFDLAGVAPIAAWQDLEFARTWLERGYAGEMLYLKDPRRRDLRCILSSVKSVVCVGLVYNASLPYSINRCSGFDDRGSVLGAADSSRSGQRESHEGESAEHRKPKTESRLASRAWISRYAWGGDYHRVIRARLETFRTAIENLAPGVETRVYVDTGPVVERAFARLSGIGWTGKNTCLINQQKGSWFFIGVVLTNIELEPHIPAVDRCGSCRRCLDACPTGALVEPYVMDASRCIAYFNIELKGSIPTEYRTAIGANVFGCDICQDVCPWNRDSGFGARGSVENSSFLADISLPSPGNRGSKTEDQNSKTEDANSKRETRAARRPATTQVAEFYPLMVEPAMDALHLEQTNHEPRTTNDELRTPKPKSRAPSPEQHKFSLFHPRLEDLASITEDDFRRVFRDSPIKRAKYRGWLRNLCVVMGNSGDRRFVPRLETMRSHSDAVVREHAEWAIGRLTERSPNS